MAEARAFWTTGPGQGEIRSEPLPALASDDVVVRTLYSGVSRGTEALVFTGKVPESEWDRMRAPFQAGTFPGPVKYGYSSVGLVEDGAESLRGQLVFALHPHQTRYVVPAAAVHVLPSGVPPARAILAANLETAINGVWDGAVQVGDRVSVIGAGAVGCLVAWLTSRIAGTDVELVDVNPARAGVASALGVRFSAPEHAASHADCVFHTSGVPGGLAHALRSAAPESTIVELSWYGSTVVPLALGEAFHSQRLTIRSSQVGQVPAARRPRWTNRRRLALALTLLRDPALDALITGESEFEALPTVMPVLTASSGETLCHRIRYAPSIEETAAHV